jgi:hypothetical protein
VSIAAMNWAWQQQLPPTPKLILMALADAANDQGICWPSVSTVATKCCVSTRTVRRVLQELGDRGLLVSEQRYRKDGSCSSNRYRLRLAGGDNLSSAPDARDLRPGQRCEGPPDVGDRPGITRGNRREPLRSQGTAPEAVVARSVESGGGPLSEPDYPKALSPAEREEARKKLARIPADVAQQLLDELAASMGANVIRTTPLAYLRGLIARAEEGRFTPEGALRIADRRNRRAAVDAALCRNETGRRGDPSLVVDADEPLIRRLLDMQSKSQEKDQGLD